MSTDPLNTSFQSSGEFSVLKHFSFLSETWARFSSIIIALHDVWKLFQITYSMRLIGLGYCLHRILWYQHIYFFIKKIFNSHIWEKNHIILSFMIGSTLKDISSILGDQFGHMLDNAGNVRKFILLDHGQLNF